MPVIEIPSALRGFVDGQTTVEVPGQTAGEVLSNLAEQHPALRRHLFDDNGKVRTFVNVFVGDEDIRNLEQGDTKIAPKDVVSIIPAVAGGSR